MVVEAKVARSLEEVLEEQDLFLGELVEVGERLEALKRVGPGLSRTVARLSERRGQIWRQLMRIQDEVEAFPR